LSNNSTELLDFCTDDVVWIPPNAPAVAGKEAIRQWLFAGDVGIRDVRIANVRIDGDGSVAFLTSNYLTECVTGLSTSTAEAVGTHLWVLRKLADGEWKVAIVTWSLWEQRP
jgi:ketosteroid isomerase-like protein